MVGRGEIVVQRCGALSFSAVLTPRQAHTMLRSGEDSIDSWARSAGPDRKRALTYLFAFVGVSFLCTLVIVQVRRAAQTGCRHDFCTFSINSTPIRVLTLSSMMWREVCRASLRAYVLCTLGSERRCRHVRSGCRCHTHSGTSAPTYQKKTLVRMTACSCALT